VKFEIHDGKLYMMLEQDSDPILNKAKRKWLCKLSNGTYKTIDQMLSLFDIVLVGYPVADYSAEWALWSIEKGDIVIHRDKGIMALLSCDGSRIKTICKDRIEGGENYPQGRNVSLPAYYEKDRWLEIAQNDAPRGWEIKEATDEKQ